MTKYGLEPVKDVSLIQLGSLPEIAAAMSKRTVHAAVFSQPMAYVAQQGGARMLANLAKENISFLHVGITTTRRFMRRTGFAGESLPARLRSRGAFHAYEKGRSQGDLQQVHQIKDPGMLEGSIVYGYDIEKIPLVRPAGFQVTLDDIAKKNPNAKTAKREQFFDR